MKKGFQMALVSLSLSAYLLTGCAKETVSTENDSSNLLESGVNNENDISLLNDFTEIKVDGVDTALLAIEEASKQIGLQDATTELSFAKEETSFENTFYTFEQMYEDIPVYGRKEVLTVDSKGNVLSLAGNYLRMNKIDLNPNIKEKDVPPVLAERYGDDVYIESYRLIIYSLFETSPQLSWDCIVRTEDVNEECIVSAIDGDILLVNSMNCFNEMKGIGEDVDNNYVEFNVDLENGHYVMQDNERFIFMYDAGNDTLRYEFCFQDSNGNIYKVKNNNFIDEKGKVVIIEDNGDVKDTNGRVVGEGAELVINARTSNIFTKLEPVTNSSSTWTNKEAVTIYSRLEKIYDMWLSEFHCKGFNNNNGTIHAVCNDNQKVYGIFDNSGNAYSDNKNGHDVLLLSFGSKNSLSSDIIGHEYMHGVITARSNLIYQGESGAIHEGLADVFGEISEDWIKNGKLDGDCDWIHSNSRNIVCPDQSPGNKEYPDTYKGFHWVDISNPSDSNDYGGVHNNSTVISHVAYLMSTGINGHICFEPLSTYQIGKLFYTVLYYIPSDCTFNELRAFSENVAEVMYKQGELTERQRDCVSNAFFQVNIFKTSKPVAKQLKLIVIPRSGDERSYDDFTLYVIDQNNKQYTYNGVDINQNDLVFPDYGDYEIRIVDNKNNNNVTSLNVKVYEKGGIDELKVYTNCGVYNSFNNVDNNKTIEMIYEEGYEDKESNRVVLGSISSDVVTIKGKLVKASNYEPPNPPYKDCTINDTSLGTSFNSDYVEYESDLQYSFRGEYVVNTTSGIQFDSPITLSYDGKEVTISEMGIINIQNLEENKTYLFKGKIYDIYYPNHESLFDGTIADYDWGNPQAEKSYENGATTTTYTIDVDKKLVSYHTYAHEKKDKDWHFIEDGHKFSEWISEYRFDRHFPFGRFIIYSPEVSSID